MQQPLLPILLLTLLLVATPQAPNAHAQATASGRILLTLSDARGLPATGREVSFMAETRTVLASCRTDGEGRCTLVLPAVPADPAGFIRGTLQVTGHGRRPLLWPGGDLALALELDEAGQLEIARDLFVTRTPVPSGTPTVTTAATGFAHSTRREAPLAADETPARGRTAEVPLLAAPPEDTPTTQQEMPWPLVTLLALLAGGMAWYAYRNARKGSSR